MNRHLYNQAASFLTEEEKQRYKYLGEQLYDTIDYETGRVNVDIDQVGGILSALKSGLRIQDLDVDEIELLKHRFGIEWQSKIDFISTSSQLLHHTLSANEPYHTTSDDLSSCN